MTQLFNPTAEVPFVITGGAEGRNCFAQAISMLQIRPDWRLIMGSILAYGRDDQLDEPGWYWQKPWHQHMWLVDTDGRIHDPSLRNLQGWANAVNITLPCPVEEMQASVIPFGKKQGDLVLKVMRAPFDAPRPEQVIYTPGLIFSCSHDDFQPTHLFTATWGMAAMQSVKAGGWTADQAAAVLSRLDDNPNQTGAMPPELVKVMHRRKVVRKPQVNASGRGFA